NRELAAHQAHQITFAFDDMHGNNFFRKTVVFVPITEMQFANGNHIVAAFAQPMMPAGHPAVISIGVVPIADLMNVLTDSKSCTSRYADRTGGLGRYEQSAPCGQPIEVWRFDDLASVASERFGRVFVGHDDQEVFRFCHGSTEVVWLTGQPLDKF